MEDIFNIWFFIYVSFFPMSFFTLISDVSQKKSKRNNVPFCTCSNANGKLFAFRHFMTIYEYDERAIVDIN